MTSEKLRNLFLEFFQKRNHIIVSSAPLVPKDDPTLLFTSAGMVQFKPYWTGSVPLPYKRACSVQKCLRMSDLEKVGETPFHETFFEMLGNFSFGDYFKKEAIQWGWEFVKDVLKLPLDKLSVTVFKDDRESYDIWKTHIGFAPDRIYKLDEKTNFWGPAGKTGACGPSTEIFFDLGETFGKVADGCTIENECDRFVEIWNIVLPQFERLKDGTNIPLKNRGIDTGMGLERTLMVCQGKKTIFDTDLFVPIIKEIKKGKNELSKRIIADHIRALTFAITEGILPSNEERGYVIRRILRKAVLEGKKLGYKKPFLYKLVGNVIDTMGEAYPEIEEKAEHTSLVIKAEEDRFLATLDSGTSIFREMIDELRKKKTKTLPGKYAFKLYDTYGFPLELSRQLAEEQGFKIDERDYEKEMEKQRDRAKGKAKFGEDIKLFDKKLAKKSHFSGFEKLSCKTKIIAVKEISDNIGILLSETPFYAEMGGQLGDTGTIKGKDLEIQVINTKASSYGNLHIGGIIHGKPKEGMTVIAEVNIERRMDIARNHTATHLLQASLRNVLGKHIHQQGSLVAADRFRFDFTHFSKVNEDETEKVETLVNENILANLPVESFEMDFKKAKKMGAIALFDEKYGDKVRVLKIGDFSMELCGGTHVRNTGEIGLFKILSESSTASGVRRIEAITGRNSLKYINAVKEREEIISQLLKVDKERIEERLRHLIENEKKLTHRIEQMEKKLGSTDAKSIKPEEIKDGIHLLIKRTAHQNMNGLRNLADEVQKLWNKKSIGVFASDYDNKVAIVAFVSDDLTEKIKANEIVKTISPIIDGGGGGKADFATAGGKKIEKIDEALKISRDFIIEKLS